MEEIQKNILIVEDDPFFSMILKGRMEKQGFAVRQAFDGEQALTMAREQAPDLIILDLIIPKLSGFEFLETIFSDPQLNRVPVVVASNLGQESDIEKAKQLGVLDYYVKVRTSVDDLVKILTNIINQGPQAVSPQ
ncbi:MAG: Response regulator receiver protein [Candidatus Adlerbacteria bacterium GW2011_GWC1_50_9]|uniref:Response regulator receiver protein n=1 Tax=Candidatus Adlerbacteria bacterium GW2011_GWC1_50_9 TaxID=1618608 RepID=A0A0G1WJP6_9BACT|nr:MAG: Response regulator receiver protein [Candidatus Adlerbacteria bacterium GW2011_GWC1_50_9]